MTFALAGGRWIEPILAKQGPTGTRFATPFSRSFPGFSIVPSWIVTFCGVRVGFLISSEENRYGYNYRSGNSGDRSGQT
jgi:hypothetical protein